MFFVVRSNDSFNFPLGLIKYTVIVIQSYIPSSRLLAFRRESFDDSWLPNRRDANFCVRMRRHDRWQTGKRRTKWKRLCCRLEDEMAPAPFASYWSLPCDTGSHQQGIMSTPVASINHRFLETNSAETRALRHVTRPVLGPRMTRKQSSVVAYNYVQ